MMKLCRLTTTILAFLSLSTNLLIRAGDNSLHDDITSLREDLEKEAWQLLRTHLSLSGSSDNQAEAEQVLRQAIAVAPFLPEPYALLANHLMDHGPRGSIREIVQLFRAAMRQQHSLSTADQTVTASELMKELHKRPSMAQHFVGATFPARLRHDKEQLELLAKRQRLPAALLKRYIQGYETILAKIPEANFLHAMNLPENLWAYTIGPVYQRGLYVPELEPLTGPALNPNLDFHQLEEEYFASTPRFISFDNLLTEEALLKLRQYYQEATVFWQDKPGYIGSYLADGGFGNPIIAQLIEELMDAFPRIICDHRINQAWAYKYDSEFAKPIDVHADVAAVNFNFWVSPDEGSLDKESGGLVVFTVSPPEGTSMDVFNQLPLHQNVTNMLAASNYANHTIPFRSNRAVVFQSDLFHKSGEMTWAPGYENRRINLTLLFGKMYGKCGNSNDDKATSKTVLDDKEL